MIFIKKSKSCQTRGIQNSDHCPKNIKLFLKFVRNKELIVHDILFMWKDLFWHFRTFRWYIWKNKLDTKWEIYRVCRWWKISKGNTSNFANIEKHNIPLEEIWDFWNEIFTNLSTDSRKKSTKYEPEKKNFWGAEDFIFIEQHKQIISFKGEGGVRVNF